MKRARQAFTTKRVEHEIHAVADRRADRRILVNCGRIDGHRTEAADQVVLGSDVGAKSLDPRIARELQLRVYGRDAPDVRESERSK